MSENAFFDITDDFDFAEVDLQSGEVLSSSEEKLQRQRRLTMLRRKIEDQLEERRIRRDYGVYDLEELQFD